MAIGMWVLLSPWLLGFNEVARPTWNAAVTGLATTLIAATAVARTSPSAAWGNVLLAMFAFITLVTASPERDDRRSPLDAR